MILPRGSCPWHEADILYEIGVINFLASTTKKKVEYQFLCKADPFWASYFNFYTNIKVTEWTTFFVRMLIPL